jgi:hypothetical protein
MWGSHTATGCFQASNAPPRHVEHSSFDALEEQHGRRGCKEYLRILELAAKESESKVDEALRTLLHQSDEPISAESVESLLGVASSASRRDVKIAAIDLSIFDLLYAEVVQ